MLFPLQAEDIYLTGSIEGEGGLTLYLQVNHRELSGWILQDQDREPSLVSGEIDRENRWSLKVISGSRSGIRLEGLWEESNWEGEWIFSEDSQELDLDKFLVVTDLSYGRMDQIHFRRQIPHFYNSGLSEWNTRLREEAFRQMGEFLTIYDSSEEELMPWNSQSTLSVSYISHNWVSMLDEIYQFTGGAHGNSYFRSRLLHRRNGRWTELYLENLIARRESLIPLAELVLTDLEEQGASWTDRKEWEKTGYDSYLEDFVITPQGITFYFEPYSVGSYAEGIYEVFIPWSDHRNLWSQLVRQNWVDGDLQ